MNSERANPPVICDALVRHFEAHAINATAKEYVTDLTQDEAAAICFFAGVPYTISGMGAVKFHACGLHKRNGKWTAYCAPFAQPNDTAQAPDGPQ